MTRVCQPIRHWDDGAAVVGLCRESGCTGRLMLVEDVGPAHPLHAQCGVCLVMTGVSREMSRRPASEEAF